MATPPGARGSSRSLVVHPLHGDQDRRGVRQLLARVRAVAVANAADCCGCAMSLKSSSALRGLMFRLEYWTQPMAPRRTSTATRPTALGAARKKGAELLTKGSKKKRITSSSGADGVTEAGSALGGWMPPDCSMECM
nr:unnamed protein product [Digitaria exilis]CAB3491882.1 unnamed protein product [Digitaria exilis]